MTNNATTKRTKAGEKLAADPCCKICGGPLDAFGICGTCGSYCVHSRGLILAVVCGLVLLAGCATKGGWPCWTWQANTDQKNEAYGKLVLQYNSLTGCAWAETNLVKRADLLKKAQAIHDEMTNLKHEN